MNAILLKITFSEAQFRVHHTIGFRNTYLIPLPPTLAGIFAALLGLPREKVPDHFGSHYFGAKLIDFKGICKELTTFVQYKTYRKDTIESEWGVMSSMILNTPTYIIASASNGSIINQLYDNLKEGIVYYPYGGQCDYFTENFEILEVKEVTKSNRVENYAPQDLVKHVKIDSDGEFQIQPVMHKLGTNPNFYFIYKGVLELTSSVPTVDGIGLYPLDRFYYLYE